MQVAIIDPITCLKSRLLNLFAYWQDRPHRESVRVKIVLRASDHYLRDLLVHERYRVISEHIRRIKALALTPLGKRFYVEYGTDVLDAIPMIRQCFQRPTRIGSDQTCAAKLMTYADGSQCSANDSPVTLSTIAILSPSQRTIRDKGIMTMRNTRAVMTSTAAINNVCNSNRPPLAVPATGGH